MTETIVVTAGKPLSRSIRIPGAALVWLDAEDCEVRAQLRQGKNTTSDLIYNIHEDMTWTVDGEDIVISWVMDGSKTRDFFALEAWPKIKKGYVNIIISDTGEVDERAVVLPLIIVKAVDTTTKASGST